MASQSSKSEASEPASDPTGPTAQGPGTETTEGTEGLTTGGLEPPKWEEGREGGRREYPTSAARIAH